jgi:hypothetical protein
MSVLKVIELIEKINNRLLGPDIFKKVGLKFNWIEKNLIMNFRPAYLLTPHTSLSLLNSSQSRNSTLRGSLPQLLKPWLDTREPLVGVLLLLMLMPSVDRYTVRLLHQECVLLWQRSLGSLDPLLFRMMKRLSHPPPAFRPWRGSCSPSLTSWPQRAYRWPLSSFL